MSDDDIEVIETEYSSGKKGLSINEIILRHLRKISDLSCQELTPSRWEKRPIKIGEGVSILEKYHPDLREAYINAVDFLFDMVNPHKNEQESKTFIRAVAALKKSETSQYQTMKKSESDQDAWIDKKLKLKRKLFAEIMIFLHKIQFFTAEEYSQ